MSSSTTNSSPPTGMTTPDVATADQPPCPRWFWPTLLGICLVGAVLRLLLRAEYLADNPLAWHPRVDAETYWNWAGRIAAGQWSDGLPFFSAPLYPYLLGLVRAVGGGLPTVYTLQILLDLVTAGLLAWIARRRFGPAVGLLAAGIFLLMLEPASFSLRILTSSLQLALICLVWLALHSAGRRPSVLRGIGAGAAVGLLALSYPPALLCLPLCGVWWWWNGGRGPAAILRGALGVVAGLVVISPATIHNYCVSGELFPIQSVVGINFRQGNGPGADGKYTPVAGLSGGRAELFHSAQRDFRRQHGRDGSWKEIDRYYRNQALAYWRADPLRALQLLGCKAYWFLTGRNYGDIYKPTLERDEGLTTRLRLSPLQTAWLIPPALLAIALWLRRANRYLPELMLFGVPLLIVVVFWYSPRYRLPAVPVVVVGSAWALWQALHWRSQWRWSVATSLAVIVGAGLGFINNTIGFDPLGPNRAEFRCQVAFAFTKESRLAEAAAWYYKALEADPDGAATHRDLAEVLARSGKPQEAREHLDVAVRAEPEDPFIRDLLGRVLVQQQRPDEAIQQFKTAVELDPNDAGFRNDLGVALLLKGQVATAIEQYAAALRIDPTHADAHLNVGRALAAQNETERALRHLAKATQFNPDLIAAYVLSAHILLAEGRAQDAVDALRAARQRAPQDDRLADELTWYLATLPGLPKADRAMALQLAKRAVLQAPEPDADRLDTLAAALAANGQFQRAVPVMQQALELAIRQGAAPRIESFRARLRLYRAGTPYVKQLPPTRPPASRPGP